MQSVFLVILIIDALFLTGLVLIQRSEGGALGGLTGGSGNSFMTGRAVGNILTKATAICAVILFIVTLILGILARHQDAAMPNLTETTETTEQQ
ncbi:MAG: preprotein translocase subunit SecG [Alphaproteobacteria bacterium]|nr:preprotein translocase subunit SecG [Alphaproteobacteria bacterium]